MPKRVDAAVQRREIRDAARRVFAHRGVAGTGLAHVAEAAGMGRSSLYHYYADKRALLRDLVAEVLAEEQDLFTALLQGDGSATGRVERLIGALVDAFETWSAAARMLFDLRLRDAPSFRPFLRRTRAELAETIAEGQRAGEIDATLSPPLAAATLIGTVDGLLFQHCVDPRTFSDLGVLRSQLLRVVQKVLAP